MANAKEVRQMANTKTVVPFTGTAEQEQRLQKVIEEHKGQKGALMPVLQGAQEIYGYLPIEVQKMISLGLDIPLEEIYGVATFYSQFTLNPKGQYKISVCLGTACYVKGSGDIFQRLQEKLWHPVRHVHADREIQPRRLPLRGRLRPCAGPDGQRRGLRPPDGRRRRHHPRQIPVTPCRSFR